MGLLDAFHETWSQARETFGQGTPEDGAKFDGSSRLLQMKSSVEAAAPDSRWQGRASDAYAAANREHAQVYGKLADLDKRMAAEVTNAANVVITGRQNLDSVKSWVTSMAASIPDTTAEERDRKLLPIVNKGVGQLSDIIQKSTNDMTDIRGRVQGIKGEYDALTNQKFGPGENGPGEKPHILYATGKDGEQSDKPELNSKNGELDGATLKSGMLQAILPPAFHERLIAAGTLSPEQLNDLAHGKPVVVGEDRMAYLYQLSQSLNGMTPEQIKAMQASLAPEDQKALAQGLAIVSNPNAKSGNANTEGVTDATRDTFVPAAGSLINLPDGMYNELSRGDRIVQEPPSFDNMGNPMPGSTRLNGVGALQDVSDIFKPAAGEYLNGSEASKSMLDAVSHYAAADVAQREATARSGVFSPAPFFSMDAHGSDLQGSLAGVVQVAANDHVSMHDLSTNPASGVDFLKGLTAENWGSHSAQIGDAFRWMDDDPHNPINSETASATAHYLSDNEQKHLQHMPGTNGQTFGTVNPELLRAMAEGVTPYLPQLAGADGEGEFNASGVESFKSQDQMASMFSVFDQDHKSGIMITNAAFDQQHHLQVNAAETGNYRGEMFAERLHSAVVAGAERAETYDREHKQFVDSERYNNAGANWDKVSSATSALGAIPPLAAPAAVASVLSPIFKDAMINPNDPSAIQGDDYLTRHFEAAHNNTVNSDNAAILRGLMNANPAMATDPAVERYLTDGQLDPAKFRGDGTPGSGLDFNFDALAERWGFKAGIWSARENKGEDAGKSWEDDD